MAHDCEALARFSLGRFSQAVVSTMKGPFLSEHLCRVSMRLGSAGARRRRTSKPISTSASPGPSHQDIPTSPSIPKPTTTPTPTTQGDKNPRKKRSSPPKEPQHLDARNWAAPVLRPLHPALVLRHREQLARAEVDVRRLARRGLPLAAGRVSLDLPGEGAGRESPRGRRHFFFLTRGLDWFC